MPADHLRELKAVEIRHAYVDEHDGHVRFQQRPQRLAGVVRLDQVFAELAEDHLVAQQLRRLIVDEQNVDWFAPVHLSQTYRCSHMRSAASNCSVFTGFAR